MEKIKCPNCNSEKVCQVVKKEFAYFIKNGERVLKIIESDTFTCDNCGFEFEDEGGN